MSIWSCCSVLSEGCGAGSMGVSCEVSGAVFRQITLFPFSSVHDSNKRIDIGGFGCVRNGHFDVRPCGILVGADKAQPSRGKVGDEHNFVPRSGIADAPNGLKVGAAVPVQRLRILNVKWHAGISTLGNGNASIRTSPGGPAAALSAEPSNTVMIEKEIRFEFVQVRH